MIQPWNPKKALAFALHLVRLLGASYSETDFILILVSWKSHWVVSSLLNSACAILDMTRLLPSSLQTFKYHARQNIKPAICEMYATRYLREDLLEDSKEAFLAIFGNDIAVLWRGNSDGICEFQHKLSGILDAMIVIVCHCRPHAVVKVLFAVLFSFYQEKLLRFPPVFAANFFGIERF